MAQGEVTFEEELLGRPENEVDLENARQWISGRRVLITGAGGSIASELARQVASAMPANLTLFNHSELPLYTCNRDIKRYFPNVPVTLVLGDIRDMKRTQEVLSNTWTDIVFHTAAIKHVPLAELHPDEASLTNIIGTLNLVMACQAAGVHTMVFVSTDKAVYPSSAMGMTKRVAEMICQTNSDKTQCFPIIRLVNVLGSTGSVVPLFSQQISSGGPLTITDPKMVRYFMTSREAADSILRVLAVRDKTDKVFAPIPGKPIHIVDLAKRMISLSGKEIEIQFTGLRPGENLHEELFYKWEDHRRSHEHGIIVGDLRKVDRSKLYSFLTSLDFACCAHQTKVVMNTLHEMMEM